MPTPVLGQTDHQTEMEKWNTPKSQGGYRPDGYKPFPKMIYRAAKSEGRIVIEERTVANEEECARAVRDGFVVGGPDKAKEKLEGLELDVARAAGEAAGAARRMSASAQAEYTRAEDATDRHVTDVPAPKRRPGRKPKATLSPKE